MASREKIRLVLADDHVALVEGMVAVIGTFDDVEVVGFVHEGKKAVHLCRLVKPDVLLLDIDIPGGSGMEVGPDVLALRPAPRLIYFSGYVNPVYVLRSIAMGASGYLLKDESTAQVVEAVRAVFNGACYYSKAARRIAAAMNVGGIKRRRSDPVLADKERRVVRLASRGLLFREVGQEMGIAPNTVRVYWNRALKKLGLKAMPHGLGPVTPEE